jgi:bacillithiol biosynthesis deacetylase BshB1
MSRPFEILPVQPVDVVAIGCHPDDVELLAGGTLIALRKSGVRVGIVDLTNGEPTPFGTPQKRAAECAAASKILDPVFRVNLDLPNRYLEDTIENRTKLASVLRPARPRVLLTHNQRDAHPDHVAAYSLVKAARFYAKLTKTEMPGEPVTINRVYFFPSYHSSTKADLSFVVPFDRQTFDEKLRAVRAYESQFAHKERQHSIINKIEQANGFLGFLGRAEFGEGFVAEEPIVMGDELLLRQ